MILILTNLQEEYALESAFQSCCYTIDIQEYTESVIDTVTGTLDMGFKSVVHFISQIGTILDTAEKSKDIAEMKDFLKKTIQKYPKFGKQTVVIRAYSDTGDSFENYITAVRNYATRGYLAVENRRVYDLLKKYHFQTGYEDKFYDVTLNGMVTYLDDALVAIKDEQKQMISKLFQFKKDAEEYANEPGFVECVKSAFKFICNKFKRKAEILCYNFDSMVYQFHRMVYSDVHKTAESLRPKKEPSKKQIREHSEKIDTIKVAGLTIDVYRTEYDNISSFICENGTQIYLENNLFKYPKGYQKAILYHEIGHSASGHFGGNGMRDEYEQMKQIKHDMKRFDKLVQKSNFSPTKSLNDDSELLYILIELDADRFSAKHGAGSVSMKKALYWDFKDQLEAVLDKHKKEDRLIIDYNMERNKIRTTLL